MEKMLVSLTTTTEFVKRQSGGRDSRQTALRDKGALRSHGRAWGRKQKGTLYRGRRTRGGGLNRSSLEESGCWNRLQVRVARCFLLDRRLWSGVCVRSPPQRLPSSVQTRSIASAVHPFPAGEQALSGLWPQSPVRSGAREGLLRAVSRGASPRAPQGHPWQCCCPQGSVRKPQLSRGTS